MVRMEDAFLSDNGDISDGLAVAFEAGLFSRLESLYHFLFPKNVGLLHSRLHNPTISLVPFSLMALHLVVCVKTQMDYPSFEVSSMPRATWFREPTDAACICPARRLKRGCNREFLGDRGIPVQLVDFIR